MDFSTANNKKDPYISTQVIESNESKTYLLMKRILDLVCALTGLLVLSWLFVIIAVLIKIEDPKGSIFFKQVRVGKNGNEFNMYKFRSMVSNAEELLSTLLIHNESSGALFKMKNDPRITRIGRFIRKTSIDELPQLWNIVKGDMSLVGPRPPLPREVEQYTDYDKQRLSVIPGCTGLWQISGRSSLGFDDMVALDLKYIKERNLQNDLKIIIKTFVILVNSKNAY